MKASLDDDDDEYGRSEICKKHDVEGGEWLGENSTVAEGKKPTEEGDLGATCGQP